MRFRCNVPVPPPLHPTYDIDQAIRAAFQEDGGVIGDITSLAIFDDGDYGEGTFICKADGIIAGVCVADRIFEIADPTLEVTWNVQDGDQVTKGAIIGKVSGKACKILVAERLCLNFLQRMSGIATLTNRMVSLIESKTKLLDTRKTAPGLRLLDKWAVLIGGGMNHRMGLFDMMMIKDNHIAAAGGITPAVNKALEYLERMKLDSITIEVETSTLEEVQEVRNLLESISENCHIKRLMLDNMVINKNEELDLTLVEQAIEILQGVDVEIEISGNVRLETINLIASTGIDFVSCGAITHSFEALDISLKIETKRKNDITTT